MSNSPIIETLLQFAGQPQVLTIQKAFIRFTGSIDAALMLSQLLFWTPAAEKHEGRNKGWIYRTDKEWGDNIYLTQYAIRAARKRLEEMGVIETDVRKANGNPTVHYHVLMDHLDELWKAFVAHPESESPSFDFADWFLRIRKNDIVDSQEPNCGFARTLTVEISSGDPHISPAVADAPLEVLDDEPQSVQQTLGFELPPPTSVPEEKVKKEPRETRKKPRTSAPAGFEDAKRAIFESLPIKYAHAFNAKAATFIVEQAQLNGWDVDTIYDDVCAAYRSMAADPFWEDKEINPMSLAKRYPFWRGKMKGRTVAASAPSEPYKPQPLFIKR